MHALEYAFLSSLALGAIALASGCAKAPAGKTEAPAVSASAQDIASANVPLAPVDCPFHGAHAGHGGMHDAGGGPHAHHGDKHRPFGDTQKYIEHLERADRATWQKPDELVARLALRPDDIVADVGAGSGYFAFRMAKLVPRGRVVALDLDPEMVRHLHQRAATQGIANVVAAQSAAEDPKVPSEATVVFIADVLHHVEQRPAWLSRLHEQMKPKSRLFIVEFKEGDLPQGPPASMKLSRKQVEGELAGAGFALVRVDTELLPYQLLFEFVRK